MNQEEETMNPVIRAVRRSRGGLGGWPPAAHGAARQRVRCALVGLPSAARDPALDIYDAGGAEFLAQLLDVCRDGSPTFARWGSEHGPSRLVIRRGLRDSYRVVVLDLVGQEVSLVPSFQLGPPASGDLRILMQGEGAVGKLMKEILVAG